MDQIKKLFEQLFLIADTPTQHGELLYLEAMKHLGTDASPRDLAPDRVGCAETVTNIAQKVFPYVPIITGSWTLWDYLTKSLNFGRVRKNIRRGDIIVSPTLGNSIGHTGIFLTPTTIASNDSKTGKFIENYTLDSWRRRFDGVLPEYIFRPL